MSNINFYKETIGKMEKNNKKIEDIDFFYVRKNEYADVDKARDKELDKDVVLKGMKKINYDNGFGGERINIDLMVVFKDGSWMERGTYDGSEWWEYKETPRRSERIKVVKDEKRILKILN